MKKTEIFENLLILLSTSFVFGGLALIADIVYR